MYVFWIEVLQYFDNVRPNATAADAFATEVMKITNHIRLWDAKLVWFWNLLTAHHQSCLSLFLSLTLTLTCHVKTLVCTILLPGNKMPLHAMLLLYRFWLTEICICHKPHPTRDETLWPTNCPPNDAHASVFLYFQYFICKTHFALVSNFEVGHFAHPFFVSFFWCCYERNSIHTVSLSHFISLIHCLFFIQPWTIAGFTSTLTVLPTYVAYSYADS